MRAGVQSGDVLTIGGRGVTPLRGSQRGDLRVGVQVVTPTKLDSAQRKLIEDFAKKAKAPGPQLAAHVLGKVVFVPWAKKGAGANDERARVRREHRLLRRRLAAPVSVKRRGAVTFQVGLRFFPVPDEVG